LKNRLKKSDSSSFSRLGMVANVRRGSCLTAEAKILLLMMPLVGWWCELEYFSFSFLFSFFI